MKIIDTALKEVKIIEPTIYGDERGFFFESFNEKKFNEALGTSVNFVQDNHSKSIKGVLRGLHYQLMPHPQGKLVRVVNGEVFDVAVDIRKESSMFGKWVGVHLTDKNARQLWVPEGFAHAFLVLSETAEFLYKTTDYWYKDLERSIQWSDETIAINWPISDNPIVSEKDRMAPTLANAEVFETR